MERLRQAWRRGVHGAWVAVVLLGSCLRFDNQWVPGTAASLAKDQIMLIRREPASFGFYRLSTQCEVYPDLHLFVERRGTPDFLAETSDANRHYFILYYLKDRRAYACRTKPGKRQSVEFAGPYPITPGEFGLLDGFRRRQIR